MGAIASFILIPKAALGGLREEAEPGERIGTADDPYWKYLQKHGREVVDFQESGYVFGALLPYLDDELDLRFKSEYDDLSNFLSQMRETTHFVLTNEHKKTVLARLSGYQFSEDHMRDFFNEIYAANEIEAGIWMLNAVDALKRALTFLDEQSVIVVIVG